MICTMFKKTNVTPGTSNGAFETNRTPGTDESSPTKTGNVSPTAAQVGMEFVEHDISPTERKKQVEEEIEKMMHALEFNGFI